VIQRRSLTKRQRIHVLAAHKNVCHLCGEIINPVREEWEVEHPIALGIGGRDDPSNWRPVHKGCHPEKTRLDRKLIAKCNRIRAKADGTYRQPKRLIAGSKNHRLKSLMSGKVIERSTGRVIKEARR